MPKQQFFLVLICFVALTTAFGENSKKKNVVGLTLVADQRDRVVLQKEAFGVNNYINTRPYAYNNPDYIKTYLESGSQYFRFPCGTPANYYNWQTGFFDLHPKMSKSHRMRMENNNKSVKRLHGEQGFLLKPFFAFLKGTETKFGIVLNVTTLSPVENGRQIAAFRKAGLSVSRVEMGNELYYNNYGGLVEDVGAYIRISKETSKLIHQEDPNTKVGVIVPSHLFTKENFLAEGPVAGKKGRQEDWYAELKGESFYDAVIIHLYTQTGMSHRTQENDLYPYPKAYRYAMAHLDARLNRALKELSSYFPNREIWITEWGLGGFSGPLRQYRMRFSYLGALHNMVFMMKIWSDPNVTATNLHSFVQWLEYERPDDKNRNGRFKKKVHFQAFAFLKDLVERSETITPMKLLGQKNYTMKEGAFRGKFSDLEGALLEGEGSRKLLLINKFEHPYHLQKIISRGGAGSSELEAMSIQSFSPNKDMAIDKALRDEFSFSHQSEVKVDENTVILPWSINIINLKN